jgi:hypothetical protein
MIDFSQIIALVIVVVAIYFIFKFIVSPALKLIFGIFLFILVLALVQYFLHINIQQLFGPYGKYLNLNAWTAAFIWVINWVSQYANEVFIFITHAIGNPK